LNEIETQLTYQPQIETRNRKQLRKNPIASHELRIDKFRVFYNIYAEEGVVDIDLYIKGKKMKL
jgi:mRNA-degrading endonuclease RelE of RelBE toxin-antitoxin system